MTLDCQKLCYVTLLAMQSCRNSARPSLLGVLPATQRSTGRMIYDYDKTNDATFVRWQACAQRRENIEWHMDIYLFIYLYTYIRLRDVFLSLQ